MLLPNGSPAEFLCSSRRGDQVYRSVSEKTSNGKLFANKCNPVDTLRGRFKLCVCGSGGGVGGDSRRRPSTRWYVKVNIEGQMRKL